jgi:hypothetical protein
MLYIQNEFHADIIDFCVGIPPLIIIIYDLRAGLSLKSLITRLISMEKHLEDDLFSNILGVSN